MGYTDTPIPADVPIPSNMQYWLECVEQGAAYVAEHPETQLGSNSAQRATSNVIRPLLGRIEWDQADPYNRLCPSGTPVGCVATAMAQVMLYWKHPNQGSGSHTWTWEGTTHTVNYDSVTYNWDLMLPKWQRNLYRAHSYCSPRSFRLQRTRCNCLSRKLLLRRLERTAHQRTGSWSSHHLLSQQRRGRSCLRH